MYNYSIPNYTPQSHSHIHTHTSQMSISQMSSAHMTPYSHTLQMTLMARDRSQWQWHYQNVIFSQLSHSMPNASPIMNANRSLDNYSPVHSGSNGYHNPQSNALPPQSPNMSSPSVSLNQYNFNYNKIALIIVAVSMNIKITQTTQIRTIMTTEIGITAIPTPVRRS